MLHFQFKRPHKDNEIKRLVFMSKAERDKEVANMRKNKSEYYRDFMSEEEMKGYIEKYYDPSRQPDKDFYYCGIRDEDLYKIFVDYRLQLKPRENGFEGYENREPGAIESMKEAYRYMKDTIDMPISDDLIKNIHQRATAHISKVRFLGGYDVELRKINGIIKDSHSGSVGFNFSMISPLGFSKMYRRFERMETFDRNDKKYLRGYVAKPFLSYAHAMQYRIGKYNQEIELAEEDESLMAKLKAIVTFIQDLDFVHPFEDGNTRVFETLLLNRELIRHGFSPTMLYDPNLFLCSAKREVLFDILRGMDTFERFKCEVEAKGQAKMRL